MLWRPYMPEHKIIINVLVVAVVVALIVMSVVFYIHKNPENVLTALLERQTITQSEPKKTDFGANVPADFPAGIPLEEESKIEQNYGLNYVDQKQFTIVFLSAKTVKENYALYADFLEKQNWIISNKYENAGLSSLYGTKGNNDINVTMNENTSTTSVKSQVSISVLNK